MLSTLDGHVALVTGAGRGIGREIAIGLAAAGARVALVARTRIELDETAHTIQTRGGTAVALPTDIADPDSAHAAVEAATSRVGSVDVLINNAAVVAPLGVIQSLAPTDVTAAFAVNIAAVVILSGLVVPGMLSIGWGRIVNISSGIAEHPAAMIGGNVYAASKAALEASTINLAAELKDTGVTVNATGQARSTPRCKHGSATSRPTRSAARSTSDSSQATPKANSSARRTPLPDCSRSLRPPCQGKSGA